MIGVFSLRSNIFITVFVGLTLPYHLHRYVLFKSKFRTDMLPLLNAENKVIDIDTDEGKSLRADCYVQPELRDDHREKKEDPNASTGATGQTTPASGSAPCPEENVDRAIPKKRPTGETTSATAKAGGSPGTPEQTYQPGQVDEAPDTPEESSPTELPKAEGLPDAPDEPPEPSSAAMAEGLLATPEES